MRFNQLSPAPGATRKRKRVGRGIGSGTGKTAGRGHKGQKARAGGFHKVGFEGGQMPMQRRLPKFGFHSMKADTIFQVRLGELSACGAGEINLTALKAAGIVGKSAKRAKVIASGTIDKAIKLVGVAATKGARTAIEAAGGTVEA